MPRDSEDAEETVHRAVRLTSSERSDIEDLLRGGDVTTSDEVGSGQREQYLWTAATSLWVQVATSLVASNLATVGLVATRRTRSGSEVEDARDSPLQELLDSPSNDVDQVDFIEQWATNLVVTGSGFVAIVRADGGSKKRLPEQLMALRSSRVEIMPGRDGEWIESIRHRNHAREVDIPWQDVIYVRRLHPMNDYWGLSQITALKESIDSDASVAAYNAAMARRHGIPGVILSSEQQVNRATARRIEREWDARHGRADQAGKAIVVDRGLKPSSPQFSPKDMEWAEMARIAKRRIFAAFGVPPALGFDFDEASELANAASQRRVFYENTMKPLARKFAAALTRFAQQNYGPEWGVRHAWESVDALREDDAATRKSVRSDYVAGLITLNEARQELDYDPRDGGDKLSEPSPASAPHAIDAGEKAVTKAVAASEAKAAQSSQEMRRLARSSYLRRHRKWMVKMRAAVDAAFAAQSERVLARARALIGDGKSVQKALSPDDILAAAFRDREEAEEFRKKLGPVFLAGIVDAGSAKLEDLLGEESQLRFAETHQRIDTAVSQWGATRIVGIVEETRRGIREAVRDALAEGAGNREVQQSIERYFAHVRDGEVGAEARAERIARTEVGTALNAGGYEATKQIEDAGGVMAKSWLSSRDELVRTSHQIADVQTRASPIPLQKPFSNGLLYPNDPSGPAGEVINCRCSMIEEVVKLPSS